ncbi:huntingtin-interacting protein 1 isoform X2 [Chelonus insularis]|uniref:huntingtin-interacting protein 1 isoform X2 n=1 Tax=Chelonus insularis TaxID=460826 RepID=UPI00158F494D|nr:huntingtin-interacting protein 1 isoform X2 [Chelonus insularis]XP_034948632.1 huntingtin-interacting protein 1 isoform X2 [Chelonus insularis]XP_034948633.1 huntingtin-interacting protein 1 isoform X2 [Chelonus insularis]XP_034948634.1 huntingtin-interacting protein 1 isoform X2 [Chelonus insularis]
MSPISPVSTKQLQHQSISISKAVNPTETPVKEKHVRSAIIGTYQEKSGAIFWMFILRQPLQENRIVAWKFCHVLHKVLREGHPRVIPDSQRHKGKLEDMGKMWQHLREGYGRLIHLYIRLLITKLEFHNRNPGLPGNLQVTNEELEAIGENDINIYFQMSVEMFDYMDDILNLQRAVFGSLDLSKSNSMTPCGQCRLAPLIPCIQDASQLYDYCVKILFKLHGALPADTLKGHRDRFSKQFQDLKTFYNTIKHMQYFKHLITIPALPENPPNFLIQSELRTYVTPVILLPQEESIEHDVTVDSLIDTSDTSSVPGDHLDAARNGSISPDALAERDSLIDHLHHENGRQREELHRLLSEHQRIVGEMRHHIRELESLVTSKSNELEHQKQLSEDLGKQHADIVLKHHELEEKNKSLDEKFQKLKEVYSKLREEHISLIRKKADVDKQLGGIKIAQEQAQRRTQEAEQRLEELLQGQATAEQEAQRVAQARSDLDDVRKQYDQAKTENLALIAKIDFISSEKAVAEGDLHDLLAQKEELDLRINQLVSEIERIRSQGKKDLDALNYELIINCITSSETMIQNASSAIEIPAISALTCTPDYLETLVNPLIQSLSDLETAYKSYETDAKEGKLLIRSLIRATFSLSIYLIHAKSTSNTSTDISLGDKLTDECKLLASQASTMLSSIKEKSPSTLDKISLVKNQINSISSMANTLIKASGNVDIIGDLVENELQSMDKAIEEAASRIQEMLNKSRAGDSGLKLEVNGKILDSCTELMKCIRKLVKKSRLLQTEIVAQGKGTASATEFYKRNHQWSEGLISAAKAIAMGANFLLEAADKVVSGDGKFEQLVVASQGIAASTAQLVVASRVKADRNSPNLAGLSETSREVTQATAGVVATAKSCGQLVEENDDLDMSGLSLHQAKRLEMEAQVRVLELEQALETERRRLAALRRHHYQMAGENEP